MAANYVDHNAPPRSPGGLVGYTGAVIMFRTSFTDITFTLDQIVAQATVSPSA